MKTTAPSVAERLTTVVLWLLVVCAAVRFVIVLKAAERHQTGEFVAYYGASRAIRDGEAVASFYDDSVFWSYTRKYGPDAKNIYYPNPPSTALFALPLGYYSFQTARLAWLSCSVFATALIILLLRKVFGLATHGTLLLVIYALLDRSVVADLIHGQAYLFITFAQALALERVEREKMSSAGSLVGLALSAKLAGPHLLLLGLFRGFRRFALSMLCVFAGLAFFSSIFFGSASWKAFLGCLTRVSSDPYLVHTSFQSLRGLVFRHLSDSALLGTRGWINAPGLASVCFVALTLAAVAAGILLYRRTSDRTMTVAFFIAISVVLSPFAQEYTYCQLLPIAAIGCKEVSVRPRSLSSVGWILGLVVLGAPLSRYLQNLEKGPLLLFAYPMVIGSLWLLYLVFVSGPGTSANHVGVKTATHAPLQ
jgi:hypothetical protein